MFAFTIESEQRERVRTVVHIDAASAQVATEPAALIRRNTASGRPTVFGLGTGSTPVWLYRQLIRLHRDEG